MGLKSVFLVATFSLGCDLVFRANLFGFLATYLCGLVILFSAVLIKDSEAFVLLSVCALGLAVLTICKTDYGHPVAAYSLPWLIVLMFSVIPISTHSRELKFSTCLLLVAITFSWILVGFRKLKIQLADSSSEEPKGAVGARLRKRAGVFVFVLFGILFLFAVINVISAGFLPLLSLLTVGDSRYFEFGIPSVYGAFLAYANAMGCLAIYIYLREKRLIYLWLFCCVLLIHILFVTRQNIATLLVEAVVIRRCVLGDGGGVKVAVWVLLAIIGFSAFGELRSGNIKEIIDVSDSYSYLPTSIIWVYSYSYFNVLNLENMIVNAGGPFYDGSMLQSLLPSVLRSEVDHGSYLEFSQMTVSSYVYPVYLDVGVAGVLAFTLIMSSLTWLFYRRAIFNRDFTSVAVYACLFFCAMFSFFVNFWCYLPVIFQIVFFVVIGHIVFESRQS